MPGARTHPESEAPLLRLLALVVRQMTDDLQRRLQDAGFVDQRLAHNTVFAHIPPEGIRLTALAERAAMTKQAMGELVADLERLGYVRRRADPADRRAKVIELTDRGWDAVSAALGSFADMERELGDDVGAPRVRTLRATLLRVLQAGERQRS
jgi:DNA-binding MarR family transcriptional regulator